LLLLDEPLLTLLGLTLLTSCLLLPLLAPQQIILPLDSLRLLLLALHLGLSLSSLGLLLTALLLLLGLLPALLLLISLLLLGGLSLLLTLRPVGLLLLRLRLLFSLRLICLSLSGLLLLPRLSLGFPLLLIGFALLLPLLLILVLLRVRQGACSDEKHCPTDYEGHDHPVIDTNFHLNSFSHFSFIKTAVKRMICLLFVWLCALKDSFHKKCGSEISGEVRQARPKCRCSRTVEFGHFGAN